MPEKSNSIANIIKYNSNRLSIGLGILFLLIVAGLTYWDTIKPTTVQKIGLHEVLKHRAYQDSIVLTIDSVNMISGFRELRGQYLTWLNRENDIKDSEEFNYYMLRLYSKINSFSFNGNFYDIKTNSGINKEEYKNIYDSIYLYYDRLLEINPNHKIANFFFAESYWIERRRYHFSNKNVPFSLERDFDKMNNRLNKLYNNVLSYYNSDTSSNKVYSRAVIELSFDQILNSVDTDNPYKSDQNMQALDFMGTLWELIKKYKNEKSALIEFNISSVDRNYYPIMLNARKRLQYQQEIKNRPQCFDDIRAYEFGREMATMVQLGSLNLETAINEYGNSLGISSPFESTHPCVKKGYEDAINNIPSPFNPEGKSWSSF
jgi:hypothetical protein